MYIRIRRKTPGTLSNRSQYAYVNHRSVRDQLISSAVLLLETGFPILLEDGVSEILL